MLLEYKKIVFTSIIITIIFVINLILIFIYYLPPENYHLSVSHSNSSGHYLCVIFPYRDRLDELNVVLPKLHKFLKAQRINFNFLIINQTDSFRFNRATLINIGSVVAKNKGCNYIAIHDIDIVPLNQKLNYNYPGKGQITHITSGKYHPIERYDYENYIGGVLIMTLEDFYKVNGMSNNYWGWGLEDDDFYFRLKFNGLANNITRPENLSTNRSNTFLHLHTRKRDYKKNEYREKRLRGRDQIGGLTTLNYSLIGEQLQRVKQVEFIVYNVKLHCNVPSCIN